MFDIPWGAMVLVAGFMAVAFVFLAGICSQCLGLLPGPAGALAWPVTFASLQDPGLCAVVLGPPYLPAYTTSGFCSPCAGPVQFLLDGLCTSPHAGRITAAVVLL